MKSILIKGGRLIDPGQGLDMRGDLLIEKGKIAWIGAGGEPALRPDLTVVEATGMVVAPGFIDMHCHLREPGFEEKETIATGTRAAARGGFTTVCCMPNTRPPVDDPATVDFIRSKALVEGVVRVLPVACITEGRLGKRLVRMERLARSGAIGFSDDGAGVQSSALMRTAMEYSLLCGLPLIQHCEDAGLSARGVLNEGWVATKLGLAGAPAAAEEVMASRDILLAQLTGAWLHVAHASTAGTVELVAQAKAKGICVTAEVTPHHLTLTDEMALGYNTNAKVNPPLRARRDVEALVAALKAGTIDVIATDHSPHTVIDKQCEFDEAAFGISGFETALPSLLTLVDEGRLDLMTLLSRLTAGPAAILRRACQGPACPAGLIPPGLGGISAGATADVVVFDPAREVVIDPASFASRGRNTPLAGRRLRGQIVATIYGGRIVYARDPERAVAGGTDGD